MLLLIPFIGISGKNELNGSENGTQQRAQSEECCGSSFDGSSNTSLSSGTESARLDEDAEEEAFGSHKNDMIEERTPSQRSNSNNESVWDNNSLRKQIFEFSSEMQEKWEGTWEGIRNMDVNDLTPNKLRAIGEKSCEKYNYYKEYFQYYLRLLLDAILHPMKAVEYAQDYARQV